MFTDCHFVDDSVDYYREPASRGNADYVVSRSDIVAVLECPAHWKNGEPFKGNESTQIGNLVDDIVETGEPSDRWAVRPRMYPEQKKRQKDGQPFYEPTGRMVAWHGSSTWCKNWQREAEAKGKEVVHEWQVERAHAAVKHLLELDLGECNVEELFDSCDLQVHVRGKYHDEATGFDIDVKALMDAVSMPESMPGHAWLYDTKAMERTAPPVFDRHKKIHGYDVQCVHYSHLLRGALEAMRGHAVELMFGWLVAMTEKPHVPESYKPKATTLEWGQKRLREGLELYCRCLKNNHWPSYSDGAFLEV